MSIEECALRIMREVNAEMAKMPLRPRVKDPYAAFALSEQVAYLVQQGGKIETARWTWLERGSRLQPKFSIRVIMDVDDPVEV